MMKRWSQKGVRLSKEMQNMLDHYDGMTCMGKMKKGGKK